MNVLEMIFFGISATVTSKSETCQTGLTRKDSSLGMTHTGSTQKYWLKGASFTGCRNVHYRGAAHRLYCRRRGIALREKVAQVEQENRSLADLGGGNRRRGWPRRKIFVNADQFAGILRTLLRLAKDNAGTGRPQNP
jgi:hypothetical protein